MFYNSETFQLQGSEDFFFGARLGGDKKHMPKVHSKSVPNHNMYAGQTIIAFRVTGSR
jgi:hypothetical protein